MHVFWLPFEHLEKTAIGIEQHPRNAIDFVVVVAGLQNGSHLGFSATDQIAAVDQLDQRNLGHTSLSSARYRGNADPSRQGITGAAASAPSAPGCVLHITFAMVLPRPNALRFAIWGSQ
ncbi:hypothetical protein Cenrod_2049 [Candidatus Symbiobacter mobilis CR]|uniref:Uncharacterized protein n=1 Tax=Candidatus Symbiobacter mobilis CR TaxID=946483 RepID=U5N9X3_9BURK|nr:hypothetical protein Cenrod_2049 [Candidatus Symbiobacter mobilis CR]